MARYTGPKRKLERREQATLFGSNAWQKRPGGPGEHPMSRRRPSEYATQLREKQKVKRMYGLLERQFRKTMHEALEVQGNTGTKLLQLLELRLDNVVYKLGLAKTRSQARQFVTHKHVKVDGKYLNIPSYIVKKGQKIELDEKVFNTMLSTGNITNETKEVPAWLDRKDNTGSLLEIPKRSELDQSIDETLIIELYSR